MKKIYYLSTCDTCKRILNQLSPLDGFELIDIKFQNIDEETLSYVAQKTGSYEALFSKRALKYKGLGLDKIQLSEAEYKNWLLKEYTFLKRPFILVDDKVFVGNAAKTVEAAKFLIHSN